MWILGRLDLDPFTYCVMTAQTQSKARDRFLAAARRLDRFYGEDQGGPHIRRGGKVDMDFANGSRMWVEPPEEDSFRGDYAHIIWFDEAQAHTPDKSEDLKQGALPLLDTVEDGQVILSGTPGKYRAGWFWDALQAGKAGTAGYMASEYSAGDDASKIDLDDEEMWLRVLPGVANGLTTIEKMRARRAGMDDATWAMEYLAIWPQGAHSGAFDMAAWSECQGAYAERPERFTVAFDCAPESGSASVVAAWLGEDETVHVELLAQQLGTQWLPKFLYDLLVKYPRSRVVYDGLGRSAMVQPAETLKRQSKIAKRVHTQNSRDVAAGQDNLVKLVDARHLHLPEDQSTFTLAAAGTQWRNSADGSGRWFSWKHSDADISPVRAAAIAVWEEQQNPVRQAVIVGNG